MLKFAIPATLALALLVLSWMSLLRVDNMAHDLAELRQDVDGLKQQLAAQPGGPPAVSPASLGLAQLPDGSAAEAPAAAETYEAAPPGYFSQASVGPLSVSLPLPKGTAPHDVQIVIVAVEGEGVPAVALPSPQPTVTLQPGVPQAIAGLCQGPEGAAWVFTLEGAAVRIESRGCTYPVRGLRPRLRAVVRR